ncbi:MAG TPA: DNA-formamidopyrimidine glycosylase family protein [Gaiellaceae bacterium]|nr:DNA-formamidopyrimidine glycosylase family protein [Gaiellaceae bacterium]
MPEGDSLHRIARRLQPLVGERLEVEAPHPQAQATGVAPRLDGRRLEGVEAVGKHLLLRFEGGVVLRSHLRMRGRWRVGARGTVAGGRPWLVLRGGAHEAVLWNGPVLELGEGPAARVGPDILAVPPDLDGMVARLRAADPTLPLGAALLRQPLVSGIGNMWLAEALWEARLSPWRRLADLGDAELREALAASHRLMRAALEGGRSARRAYRRAGRPCPRCGTAIRSRRLGDDARTAYWCPACQPGEGEAAPGA